MQFSFAFSGKLHRVSISSGNRPRYTKCVSILSSEGFGCRLIDSLFSISDSFSFVKNFFKTFFEVFEAILSKLKLFLTAVSFETAYLLYQTEIRLSRTFFVLFKPLFRSTAAPLSDSFNRIPQSSPPVNKNFQFFSYFLKLVVFCFLCYNKYRTLRTKPQRCLYLP